MKLNTMLILCLAIFFSQLSFSNTLANNQEYLIKYVDKELANVELVINKTLEGKINLVEKKLLGEYSSFLETYKHIAIIIYSLIIAILIVVVILILSTYSLAKKTQKLYQTPQIFKPNIAITRQNPFYYLTDGDIFKLLDILDSWLDEDDYLMKVAVLMYYLPEKHAHLIWENLKEKNELINALLRFDCVDQEYVTKLAETIQNNIKNTIDKTDALGTVFDKLPEHHRTKILKTITEENILPKGYVLRFIDVFKQPKNILKERFNYIPTQTIGLIMQTINKSQSKIIMDSLQTKKANELKEYLKLLENQKICQESIDKAKEFIVKYFNYNA